MECEYSVCVACQRGYKLDIGKCFLEDPSKEDDLPKIIGFVVAGGVLLICLIAIFAYKIRKCLQERKRKKEMEKLEGREPISTKHKNVSNKKGKKSSSKEFSPSPSKFNWAKGFPQNQEGIEAASVNIKSHKLGSKVQGLITSVASHSKKYIKKSQNITSNQINSSEQFIQSDSKDKKNPRIHKQGPFQRQVTSKNISKQSKEVSKKMSYTSQDGIP